MDGVGVHVVSYGQGKDSLQGRGFPAGHDVTGIVNLREELREGPLQLLERAVNVQVVRLDIGNDGDVRGVVEEGAIVLVGFHDEVVAVTGQGVCAQVDR